MATESAKTHRWRNVLTSCAMAVRCHRPYVTLDRNREAKCRFLWLRSPTHACSGKPIRSNGRHQGEIVVSVRLNVEKGFDTVDAANQIRSQDNQPVLCVRYRTVRYWVSIVGSLGGALLVLCLRVRFGLGRTLSPGPLPAGVSVRVLVAVIDALITNSIRFHRDSVSKSWYFFGHRAIPYSRGQIRVNPGFLLFQSNGFGTFFFQTCNPSHTKGHLCPLRRMMRLVPRMCWALSVLKKSLVDQYDEIARHHQAPQPLALRLTLCR
jgi:hypothetical protein